MRIKTLTDITNMSFSELVSYEVSSNSSLLLLRLSEKMSIIDHQVKMAENNKICRTSPFYIVRRDGNIYSCYDITSLVSLSFFLKRKKLSREELIRIFIDIAGNLLNCSGYLLDDKRYLIEPDFIFINPETMEINMIYIPAELPDEDRGNGEAVNGEAGNGEVRCEEAGKPVPGSRDNRYFPVIPDAAIEFRNLVYDLMLNRVELKECNTGDYFGRILTYFRNNTYSIQGFISLLLDLLKEETFKEGYDIQTNFSAILPGFEIRPNPDNRPALKETNPGEGALISEKFQKEVSYAGKKETVTNSDNTESPGFSFLKNLFKGNLKTIKSSDNNSSQKNNKPEKNDVISINKTGNYKSFNEEKCKDEHSKEAGVHNGLIGDVCNKTMLLSDININIPVLKSLNKMDYDDIFLNKNEIIIGRLAVQCDFVCKNPAVGKIHAVISKRSDTKYCIKDMNSVNGTFINNKRITSNVDYYALKEGDRVALANNEYIFLLNPYNYPCHSGTS